MNTMMKNALAAFGLAACMSLPALAADKVVTTDGKEYVGEIISRTENVIVIRVRYGSLTREHTLWMGDVAEITTVADAPGTVPAQAPATPAGPSLTGGAAAPAARTPAAAGQPQIILLPLTGMVGIEFRHQEIVEAGKKADEVKEATGVAPIIVLEIESGGGMVLEIYKIHDALMDLKKRHRVVAWIKEAISAACATALHCDEIYFRTEGNAGAMTAFAGATSVQGQDLATWLSDASEWAEAGGRPGMIARAMVDEAYELSYSIDEETGEVTWYDSNEGDHILSNKGTNLSFTSSTAIHSKFADGIADTTDELAELLDLKAWSEVEDGYGRELHEDWMRTLERGRSEIPKIFDRVRTAGQTAGGDEVVALGRAIEQLKQLIRWREIAPNLCDYEFGIPPREELERQIAQLQRQIAEIRRRERGR